MRLGRARIPQATPTAESIALAERYAHEGTSIAVPNILAAARWPESELARLPPTLRPRAGQTLDLILHKSVLLLQSV